MFIDTHAHLYQDKFKEDIGAIIKRCIEQKVDRIYLPNVDSATTQSMIDLEAKFPEFCFAMMGLHPCSVKENYKDELQHVEEMLGQRAFKGVGEIGIDLFWEQKFFEEQKDAYQVQIEFARTHQLPFVIHSRDALEHTISGVEQLQDGSLNGIFHCFNGTIDQMNRIVDQGFLIGLGGVITFKNAKLDEMIRRAPLESIVLETDAPYLAPVPHRGKRNESSYIPIVAQKIAKIKSMTRLESVYTSKGYRGFESPTLR